MPKSSRAQAGDTIVEVLIAIAVISSVLAITYSIMNRNLLTMRDNQERAEATKLIQAQLEALKARQWAGQAIPGDDGLGFCITPWATPALSAPAPADEMNSDDFANYGAQYPTNASDEQGCASKDGLYYVGIRRTGSSPDFLYRVTVRWDSLNGGRSQVSAVYRLQ